MSNVNLSSVCSCCIGEQAKRFSLNQGGCSTVSDLKAFMLFNPLATKIFFFFFFFENLIKNTYYWLDQRKKVKNAKKNFKGIFLRFF